MDVVQPASPFRGGEGLWYFRRIVYFSTRTDNRIWACDTQAPIEQMGQDRQRGPTHADGL